MTRDEARKLAHKLLGKWTRQCDELGDSEHTQICDTVTDNVISGGAYLLEMMKKPQGRPAGW